MTHQDIVALLTAEHEQLLRLFDELSQAPPARSEELFTFLVAHLASHEAAEQALVHRTVYEEIPAGHRVADAVLAEEEEADRLLAEMEDLDRLSDAFHDALARLREVVLAHADHAEHVEFPLLLRHLTPERRQELGERFLQLSQQTPTPTHGIAQPSSGQPSSEGRSGTDAKVAAFDRGRDMPHETISD